MSHHKTWLRTPESRFNHLQDYPYSPNYIQLEHGRMHYIDEGKTNNKVIFLLHGQPSWSYLYRHMIPLFVNAGYRVIAPDLVGFGKSDKPLNPDLHTYQNHVDWMKTFVEKLNLNHAAAFMQDWGGMIGLRVLADKPDWLNHLIVANTALEEVHGLGKFILPNVLKFLERCSKNPTVKKFKNKQNYSNWAGYFNKSEKLEIGQIIQILTTKHLREEEIYAYDAPFPDDTYYAGPRTMPQIVATDLNKVNIAWKKLKNWEKPVLTLFSDKDPFLTERGYDKKFQNNFKGAKNQPHFTIKNASHFLQEDQSIDLANHTINWFKQNRY